MSVDLPLRRWQVPVAYSMVDMSLTAEPWEYGPFQEYFCLWTAFNAVYATITELSHDVQRVRLIPSNEDPEFRQIWHIKQPRLHSMTERDQIMVAIKQLDSRIRHLLVIHTSTKFFVYRTPRWRHFDISHDAWGQKLNGVINIGYTISNKYPIWSPIDVIRYERYIAGNGHDNDLDVLTEQIVKVLYTVRNNLVHGGKRADDANDRGVVQHAIPLLRVLLNYFLVEASLEQ